MGSTDPTSRRCKVLVVHRALHHLPAAPSRSLRHPSCLRSSRRTLRALIPNLVAKSLMGGTTLVQIDDRLHVRG
jgi:hypothetical protein